MKQTTAIALAAVLLALAEELDPSIASGAEAPATGDAPKPRGRPKGSTNAPAPADKPSEAPATPPPAEAPAPEPAKGATDEQRLEANKLLIQPLLLAKKGPDVKTIVARYGSDGMKSIPSDKQAQFEADIAEYVKNGMSFDEEV